MKKMLSLIMVFAVAFAFSSSALATDNESTPGQGFAVDDTNGNVLTFKFSPKVVGQYLTDGTSGNMQWFAICTYHGGGTNFYGTSVTDTVIYKKSRTTDQDLAAADLPATASEEAGAEATADTEAVPSVWASSDWTI